MKAMEGHQGHQRGLHKWGATTQTPWMPCRVSCLHYSKCWCLLPGTLNSNVYHVNRFFNVGGAICPARTLRVHGRAATSATSNLNASGRVSHDNGDLAKGQRQRANTGGLCSTCLRVVVSCMLRGAMFSVHELSGAYRGHPDAMSFVMSSSSGATSLVSLRNSNRRSTARCGLVRYELRLLVVQLFVTCAFRLVSLHVVFCTQWRWHSRQKQPDQQRICHVLSK